MMGLLQKAYETYENHSHLVGVYHGQTPESDEKPQEPLAPIAHIITAAQIEIMLDQHGRFVKASAVDKKEPKIIIPATEESSGRSGKCPSPHPLCDQIGYISPDNEKKYNDYVEQLTNWAQSEYSHPMLEPILTYVKGKTIMTDLARSGIKNINEKDTVRWYVVGLKGDDGGGCWTNRTLFDSFIKYYTKKKSEENQVLCMITGQTTAQANQHLKGIIAIKGNAKLISANDTTNFTYRGRFKTDDQAVTIGYDASQKAHNALKWLAANQGVIIGGRTFLCWNPQGKQIPSVKSPIRRKNQNPVVKVDDYERELRNALLSYKNNFTRADTAVMAIFDAATTGRLAVTYYNEIRVHYFLERLEEWDKSCCFRDNRFGIDSPPLDRIINCAFGNERNGMIDADERIVKQQLQRLVICRVNGEKIPYDIVHAIAQKTAQPLACGKLSMRTATACGYIIWETHTPAVLSIMVSRSRMTLLKQ